jgi:hypothetical protein
MQIHRRAVLSLPLVGLAWMDRFLAPSPAAHSTPLHAAGLGVPPGGRYTMTAFTNSSESTMYVYESADATSYRLLRGSAYSPPTGLVRDPSMFRHIDGNYYLTYTTGWDGDTIGFARSPDRVNWTFLRNYTVPIPGVRHTWAPVWFLDGGAVNVIVSLSTGGDFTPHVMTAADPSLAQWSPLLPLAGLGPNYIDTTVILIDGQYHAFTKNETTKYVEHAVADNVAGPYTYVGTDDWAGWGAPREGQSLVRLPDGGGWRIYLDGYLDGKYYYSDSHDGFATWSPLVQLPGLSGFVRHFTVLNETIL